MATKVSLALGALVIAVAAFYAGMRYPEFMAASSPAPATQTQNAQAPTAVFGEITTTGPVFTIRLSNGTSRSFTLSTTTNVIAAPAHISAQELKTGTTVSVVGIAGTDGTLSAQAVQVIPPAPAPPAK